MTTTAHRPRPAPTGAEALLRRVVKPAYVWFRTRAAHAFFDDRFHVHTEEHVDLERLGLRAPDRVSYVPCSLAVLPRVLPRRAVGPEDVLLDAGSGMGRIVLQAAMRYPMRRVVGVELSEQLHRVAELNLAHNRARLRARVDLVNTDICDFEIPDDVTIVFLYNPFKGAILAGFADRLAASVDRVPRPLRIIYVNPEDEESLLAGGRVRPRGARRVGRWRIRLYDVPPAA